MIPANYGEWRDFIEVKCRLPLTQQVIQERIAALGNESDNETKKFRDLYGDDYWMQVRSWYQQALGDANS